MLPEYTAARMQDVLDEPVGTFLYGVVCLVFLVLVTVVLAIPIIGLVVTVPLVLLSHLVWPAGSAVAFLAVANRLVGHGEGWTEPLLVAAGIDGLLTVAGVGGLVAFAVGAAGFGAVLLEDLKPVDRPAAGLALVLLYPSS